MKRVPRRDKFTARSTLSHANRCYSEGLHVRVYYNDQLQEIPDGSTIADLLVLLELEPNYVAVEVNFDLVPRTDHAGYELSDGDRLEIVTLVGGG